MENNNKKRNSISLLFGRLFGARKYDNIMVEEQMQSPFRTIVRNFIHNRIAMTGLILFTCIFLFVIFAPMYYKLDLSYNESSQINISPGLDLMKVPKELQGNVEHISVGSAFSVGASKDGELFVWGHTRFSNTVDVKNIPTVDKEGNAIDYGKVVKVAAGFDHVLALNEEGKVFAWGNNRLKQSNVPDEIYDYEKIVQIVAGYQISVVVTEDGYVEFWGNESLNDVRVKRSQQGEIKKVALAGDAMIGLTFDGEVVYLGKKDTAYKNIPEEALSNVVDIAATTSTCAAVLEDGRIIVWGNVTKGENIIPKINSKIISITSGRYHYNALTQDHQVFSWGSDYYKQTDVPASIQTMNADAIYSGYYQNYAVDANGNVKTWGLKGYLLGSDGLGRDVLNRLINGGKMTMTIGAIAVVISTFIGVIIGGISGFFGGKVDMALQRITEVVSALPFLPFAMILSSIIGNNLPETYRIMLIMIVLGVLSWPPLARLVRAQVLAEREKEFVTAARAMGVKKYKIIFKHIIPNVISVIIVSATLDFAICMLTESTLSYLGFGVSLPRPTWGNMLSGSNNSVIIQNYWWQWVFPAIILSICVICINCVGDGLRDAIDPKSNER